VVGPAFPTTLALALPATKHRTNEQVCIRGAAFCPDLGCGPFVLPFFPVEWSKSGDHFIVEVGFGHVRVYRTADLSIVASWAVKDPGDFPAVGFLNDSAAFEFQDHSRMHFHEWGAGGGGKR